MPLTLRVGEVPYWKVSGYIFIFLSLIFQPYEEKIGENRQKCLHKVYTYSNIARLSEFRSGARPRS